MEEDKKPESTKKQSKHFLSVYIVGLFSIALVLILLSYLTQVRAGKQLQEMNAELSQQTSAAQGATQKMNVLQTTVEEQSKTITEQTELLDELMQLTDGIGLPQATEDTPDILAQVQLLRERYLALDALQQVRRAMAANDTVMANELMEKMITAYGVERLTDAQTQQSVLVGSNAQEFIQYQSSLQNASAAN